MKMGSFYRNTVSPVTTEQGYFVTCCTIFSASYIY